MGIVTERYTEFSLEDKERPRRYFEYYVTGGGIFPFDMLRYDSCWPVGGDDAAMMSADYSPLTPREARMPRSIKMRSYREPTIARWSSFNWSVGSEKLR